MRKSIVISGIGMATSVGLNALQAYHSVRAGISRVSEIEHYDQIFQPFKMATIPDDCFSPLIQSPDNKINVTRANERIVSIATIALKDLLKDLSGGYLPQNIPFYIGMNPDNPNEDHLFDLLIQGIEPSLNTAKCQIIAKGRAAGMYALEEAWLALEQNGVDYAIVAGCDSYKNLHRLKYLDRDARINSSVSPDGFIPGEGACFLLVTKEETARQNNWKTYARLTNAASGFEEGHLYSDTPYRGDGLAACFHQLFNDYQASEKVGHIFSSMNGENYWAKEWGVAYLRSKDYIQENFVMNHPAEFMGDTGAACGSILLGLAATAMHLKHLASPILAYASSDTGERGAVLVEAI